MALHYKSIISNKSWRLVGPIRDHYPFISKQELTNIPLTKWNNTCQNNAYNHVDGTKLITAEIHAVVTQNLAVP